MATSSASSASSTANGPRGPPPSSFSRSSDVGGSSAVGAANGTTSSASNSSSSQQGHVNGDRASNESRRGTAAGAGGGPHQRSLSLMSGGRSDRAGSVDGAMSAYSKMTVFDEVLESGDTVRVSLTPDRMKTFDVSSLLNIFTSGPTLV
jgi:hypothetical protein